MLSVNEYEIYIIFRNLKTTASLSSPLQNRYKNDDNGINDKSNTQNNNNDDDNYMILILTLMAMMAIIIVLLIYE